MYVNTHVDDDTKASEYDAWYHDVHFPDVTEPGIFVNATMFHNANAPLPDGEGRFLAFSETFQDDVEAAGITFARTVATLEQERRIHAGTLGRAFGIYRQCCLVLGTERRRRSQSLLAVHIELSDESSADDLRAWYGEEHIPQIIGLGSYHSGSLNEFVPLAPFAVATEGMPRFLALYESDIGDPRALAGRLAEQFPGGPPGFVEVVRASVFYRSDGR